MLLDRPLMSVAPTLDGDVLAVLANASDARFTTGQLHRVLERFSEHGIRKVLARLVDQGTVLVEQVGNAAAYSINRDHLAFGPITELSRSRSELINRLTSLVTKWRLQPRYAAVFGSAVHGAMRADSDIDVLVVRGDVDSDLDWDTQYSDLVMKIRRWTGNRAEIVALTESEIRERGRDALLEDVRVFGACIGGDREWFELAVRDSGRV